MSRSVVLDISSFPNELRFLMRLLRSDIKLEQEEAALLAKELNWEVFLRYAVYHEIYPVLYHILIVLNNKVQWTPDFVMDELKALYSQNSLKMLQLSGEIKHINKLLEERGIRTLFLKGPVIDAILYGKMSGTNSGELDILVSKLDWNASAQQLQSAGFVNIEQYEAVDPANKYDHASYFHMEKNKINLHWNLSPEIINRSSFEELWARRQGCSMNKRIYTLGKEDLLFYLILYGTRRGWSNLKWLLNIDLMMSQYLNWNRMSQLFEVSHTRLLGGEAFILATHLLGTLLPEEAYVMTHEPKSRRLAQMVLPFIREELTLFPKPERKDIAKLFNRYLLMTMSPRKKYFIKSTNSIQV